ncbi:MAG: rhodanese-like domain-containing protein [Polyangiaceae bacterium]|jgi:rhodanese-related sulfurtransferase|nr:rhodanese-like domain-containing protein [Polyangiaceae bacterium]
MSSDKMILALLLGLVAFTLFRQMAGKVDPARARALVDAGARLVDVRSPGEFSGGHLPGAINLPVGELGARLSELPDRERPLVVYCASGMRSAAAASLLRGKGFREVHDLGAMARWGS